MRLIESPDGACGVIWESYDGRTDGRTAETDRSTKKERRSAKSCAECVHSGSWRSEEVGLEVSGVSGVECDSVRRAGDVVASGSRGLRGSAAKGHLRNLKLVRMLLDPVSPSHALSRECNALLTPAHVTWAQNDSCWQNFSQKEYEKKKKGKTAPLAHRASRR